MHLWNEYEGQTIAEAYPLQKLLRPEGRSAFFLTTVLNGKNDTKDSKPDLIRLTESLNDEHEMLARWRQVSEVHQPNLVTIKTFGKTTFDGVRLTYALMEQNDSSLDEILRERPLTPTETAEVGVSVAAALSALHAIDLIHAHVEAVNVLAVGEIIKLRSDCVRECIPDPEFNPPALCQQARQQDVRDLGMLLLRCLTLERTFHPAVRLPAPFDKVIPRAIDGTWSLDEITRVLAPPPVKPLVPPQVLAGASQPSAFPRAETPAAATQVGVQPATSVQAGLSNQPLPNSNPKTNTAPETAEPYLSSSSQIPLPLRTDRSPDLHRVQAAPLALLRSTNPWLLMAAAALVLILGIWVFSSSRSSSAPPVSASIDNPATHAAPPAPAAAPVVTAQPSVAPVAVAGPTDPQPGWHVIAYTFNHENQAWARISALKKAHPDLNARLFHPSSRAPFYVAIGGAMSESEAESIRNRARHMGLPRDTFARYYQAS